MQRKQPKIKNAFSFMAVPDEKEKLLIDQLREKTQDVLTNEYQRSDIYLICWIRARGHNLDNAEAMLRNSLKWRKENQIDKILEKTPDEYFIKGYPYSLNGVDRKGQPVLCIPVAKWNIRKVFEDQRMEEFSKYSNRLFERLDETIRVRNARRNKNHLPITQFTLILNYDQFSMMQMTNIKVVQSMLQFALTYEAHYPEILDKAFFINTNTVFQALFALMKPLLASRTLKKITCYGTDRMEWEPVIRDAIDESQIAAQFGG